MKQQQVLFLVSCATAAFAPLWTGQPAPERAVDFPGWPTHYEGRPLSPTAMTDRDRGFAIRFPGRIQTFTDGSRTLVLRFVSRPTRRLHPSAECFRGAGYAVRPLPVLKRDRERWSGFEASRGDDHLIVHERIESEAGQHWFDVSSWYWDALLGRSGGPWWAITVVERGD